MSINLKVYLKNVEKQSEKNFMNCSFIKDNMSDNSIYSDYIEIELEDTLELSVNAKNALKCDNNVIKWEVIPVSDEAIIDFCDQLTVEEENIDENFDTDFCDVTLTDTDTIFDYDQIKGKKLKKYYYPGNDNLGYFAAVFYSII